MKLTLKEIKDIAFGYESAKEAFGGVIFERFTDKEFNVYKDNAGLFPRTHTPAGVKMRFKTDASAVNIDLEVKPGTDRHFFAVDVYSNGEFVGCIKNYDTEKMTGAYSETLDGKVIMYPSGDFNGAFELGEGEKEVKIFLPWSLETVIKKIELVGATYFVPICYDKTMLIYGDSITHGYDCINPSHAYSVRLAEALGAKCHIKAIGGDIFRPALAEASTVRKYDYISIAYGTNDYGTYKKIEDFREKAESFIKTVSEKFPDSQIFVITPIWRKFIRNEREDYNMGLIHETLKSISDGLTNVKCIYGWDLVPHDETMYGDLRLHPSDDGFKHYANNLLAEICK